MLTLPHVFSSNALYQADAPLTLRGRAAPCSTVTASLARGEFHAEAAAQSDEDGVFSLTLHTPAASAEEAEIRITDGEDEAILQNILFGELWLASGQSNMELPNSAIPDCERMYDIIASRTVRVYNVSYDVPENRFPWDPQPDQRGEWILPADRAGLSGVSAMGLKFAETLSRTLGDGIPVGFLNASWGGTPITAWFPRAAIEDDPMMTETCRRCGTLPDHETWNTRGDTNFQQPTAQYNLKIGPLEGLRVRGVLWYQGENECGGEYWQRSYAEYLRFYQRVYAERFAADPEKFYMISSLIYPWTYGPSGECNFGYLNDAFVTVTKESPDKFAFFPISHLEPDWAFHQNNHPIHPTNKYYAGEYAGELALANVYDRGGERSPAILESWEIAGHRIRLTFPESTRFLRVGTSPHERARGLYVAGEDGLYLPAEYEITGRNTMEIWCDEIEHPVHCAYNVQSMEPKVNLYAGDFPVAPFFTDHEHYLNIEARPWYDCGASSRWASKMHDAVLDLFFRPVFEPLKNSAVCPDTAFRRRDPVSLRVEGEEEDFGFFVRAYPYQRLDFQKYGGLTLNLYHAADAAPSLSLVTDAGETVLPIEKTAELGAGWASYEIRFGDLPEDEIRRMEFRFRLASPDYRFVNVEHLRLFRKS